MLVRRNQRHQAWPGQYEFATRRQAVPNRGEPIELGEDAFDLCVLLGRQGFALVPARWVGALPVAAPPAVGTCGPIVVHPHARKEWRT